MLVKNGRPQGLATALAFAGLYIVVDAVILIMVAGSHFPWALVALSYATKVGAAWYGGWLAAKQSVAST